MTGRVYAGPASRCRLRRGDLLLVDEAGMLDQDTARALLTIADDAGARVAWSGTATSLRRSAAAACWTWPPRGPTRGAIWTRCTASSTVTPGRPAADLPGPRIRRPDPADPDRDQPDPVFDALTTRGQMHVQRDVRTTIAAIADQVAADRKAGRASRRRRHPRASRRVNEAIRDAPGHPGAVDDTARHDRAGERIGVGDVIATRATTPTWAWRTATPGPSPASPRRLPHRHRRTRSRDAPRRLRRRAP